MSPTIIAVGLFITGLFLVIKGGDFFVDAAAWVSDATGISKVVIGATLVSFATTAPELFTSLIATLSHSNDIAVGNAVGSPSANMGLGFAMLALFTPSAVRDKLFALKTLIMVTAAALLLAFCLNGNLTWVEGGVLLVVFLISMYINIHYAKDADAPRRVPQTRRSIVSNVAKFIVGISAIILGAKLLVDNGQRLAIGLGIPESVVGLTFVAIGTSLPEIVTAITAIVKKQNSLSIGNIIGANILDTTLILTLCSFVSGGKTGGLSVSPNTVRYDVPVLLAMGLIILIPTAIGKKIYRLQGAALLALYAAYIVYISFFLGDPAAV
ncbi:MAG: calcium/sodium antiporter [Oscillospiraceae bacterium]|jgi:cation:H+ antiporter|nr:calcium/sodium antiporter [Oscillospiraceae bacterium]